MRLTQLLAEAWASARAQKVPTVLVAVLVAAMCATTGLTVGRAAAAQAQVAARLDGAGSRHLAFTDAQDNGFLTEAVIEQAAGLSTVERAIGFASTVDATNTAIGAGGSRVPTWLVLGDLRAAVTLTAGRWPAPGEALVSPAAQAALGMDAPAGSVTAVSTAGSSASYPIVGVFTPRAPYPELGEGVVVQAAADTAARRLDVVATTAAAAVITQDAVLALLDRSNPADLTVTSPQSLAQIQSDVLGDLARYNHSLMVLVLAAVALLVAVVALADVLVRRTEIGRRRALGAPRWALTWIVITRSLIGALVGAVPGTAVAAVLVARLGQRLDPTFTAATAVLALLATALATTVPALLAAHQDPVRVLRTP